MEIRDIQKKCIALYFEIYYIEYKLFFKKKFSYFIFFEIFFIY